MIEMECLERTEGEEGGGEGRETGERGREGGEERGRKGGMARTKVYV